MRRVLMIAIAAATLQGCVTARETVVEFYTKPEVDAMLERVQCKALARTALQMARCLVLER